MSRPVPDSSSDSEEDDVLCPICVEPFDESDRLFLPCHCNYRVCMFCVRRLTTEFDGRCPGCRTVYNEANFRIKEAGPEELAKRKAREQLKVKERLARQAAKQPPLLQLNAVKVNIRPIMAGGSMVGKQVLKQQHTSPIHTASGGAGHQPAPMNLQHDSSQESVLAQQRKNLVNVRIVQKHIVFVLGLSLSLAKEEILRRPEHFGKYGQIVKIVIGHPAPMPGRQASASAQIAFSRPEDAAEAVRGMDGVVVDGHQIRASFGTTRYCQAWLRGQTCHNPECLFLHQEVDASATAMSVVVTPGKLPQPLIAAASSNVAVAHAPNGNAAQKAPVQPIVAAPLPEVVVVPPVPQPPRVEPLNGIEFSLYEKQRGPVQQSLPRAIGQGVQRAPSLASPTTSSNASFVANDCTLNLVAELLLNRVPMSEEMRKRLSLIIGPRATSSSFSGLECVLAGPMPLFIAPLVADAAGMDGEGSASDSSKDKKLTKKGRKAAAAAARGDVIE